MPPQTRSLFPLGRIVRWFLACIAVLLTPVVVYAGYLLWQNNRSVDAPSPRVISDSLEKGITWLVNNRTNVLSQKNPMIWWMIMESASITQDKRLQSLFLEYRSRHLDPYPNYVWWYLFDPQSKAPIMMEQLSHLPDYNLYFLYGSSCNSKLAQDVIVRRQEDAEFCKNYHPFSPACATHQLMGARFVQRNGCLGAQKSKDLIRTLQERIVAQLTWDPRVVDAYIQRLLMLVESGVMVQIKPVWLWRVLDAQSADGGWDDFHPVFPVGRSRYIGLSGYGIGIRRLDSGSDLHATAQGVFLMSLVANEANKGSGKRQ